MWKGRVYPRETLGYRIMTRKGTIVMFWHRSRRKALLVTIVCSLVTFTFRMYKYYLLNEGLFISQDASYNTHYIVLNYRNYNI